MSKQAVYGYGFLTRFEALGIRFIEGEEGGAPAAPSAPVPPAQVKDETDWKAEARKWESRAKENVSAAQRLAEIEDAAKSDLERAQGEAEKAKADAVAARAESLRMRVALTKGIPEDMQGMLQGSSQEELEASADKLLAFRGEQAPAEPVKQTYIIPDEGGVPAIGKQENISPGMGTLRAAYAQGSN